MPTVSELIKTVSQVVQIPEEDVALYARRLREAGLLPKSVGRSHGQINRKHCARLVTALLTADNARNAPETVRAYKPLVEHLSKIMKDISWAENIGGIRVNRGLGEVNIVDLSGKTPRPGKFKGRMDKPKHSQSHLHITASLPKGALFEIVSDLFEIASARTDQQ